MTDISLTPSRTKRSSGTAPTGGTTPPEPSTRRPSALRRTLLVASAVPALFFPVVWTANISRMLLTGIDTDHRFHQITGQGLVLMALWLGSLLPLLRAGWAGRRPPTSAGLLHLTFSLVALATAAISPGGGAPFLAGLIAITGALVWLALPVRPRLRGVVSGVDPVLAPLALVAAALYAPFVVDQLALQNAATGFHAQNPHFWDMAWMSVVLVVAGGIAAVVPTARKLALWMTFGSLVIGVAGLAFSEAVVWSALVATLGVVGSGIVLARLRAHALTFRS